ncbi:MAG: hypothetical protein PVH24_04615 [Candidatus Zixiibacteriota bacterium]
MTTEVKTYALPDIGKYPDISEISCKFILIRRDEILNFIIGPVASFSYHANLVNHFCREYNIPASWVRRPDTVEIHDFSVRIRGGGWATISPKTRALLLYGSSKVYGRFHPDELELFIKTNPFFSQFSVTLDA